ncbi:unnamed protein product [Camellia sinensis]
MIRIIPYSAVQLFAYEIYKWGRMASQRTMGGPVAPAATHVHSQQQSHAYTSSFNCHHLSEEVHISKKENKKKKKKK